MKKWLFGFVVTLALSMSVLVLFFGQALRSPGSVLFNTSDVGLTHYYSADYHARFDAEDHRFTGMNYPFGEMVFYTSTQPLVVNTIRFVSGNLIDLTENTVAIVNLAVLFSIVWAALFLWLIFMELGVAWWYGSLSATAIVMLSPQLAQLSGQYTLAWLFWIPLILYLVIRFDRTRKLPFTLFLGLVTLSAGMLHIFFVVLSAIIIGGYWFFRFIWYRQARTYWYRDIIHIFLQFVLPVIILQLLALMNEDVTDRTAWPAGLYDTLAHPAGVFLPNQKPWLFIAGLFPVLNRLSAESMAYVGTVGLSGFITGAVFMVKKISRKQAFLKVTHIASLNVFFWVSTIALLFSFGLPMVLGLKRVADYFEPLRQLQDLSRFSWLFYYALNLVVLAAVYHWAFVGGSPLYRKMIGTAALALILVEGMFHVSHVSSPVMSPSWLTGHNTMVNEDNDWAGKVTSGAYQAIVPVPGFHTGSENIWYHENHPVRTFTRMVSLQTGLPTTGADLKRTSIAQTWNQLALYTEPLERLEFSDFLPDERPVLLLQVRDYDPSEEELRMMKHAVFLDETPDFLLYKLPVAVIRRLNLMYKNEVISHYETASLHMRDDGWEISDPQAFFFHESFDEGASGQGFDGSGAYRFPAREQHTLWKYQLQGISSGTRLLVSFWAANFRQDAWMRTTARIRLTDLNAGAIVYEADTQFHQNIKAISGDWALIEFPVEVKTGHEVIELMVFHDVLPSGEFVVDELMVRQDGLDVFRRTESRLWMNNRRVIMR